MIERNTIHHADALDLLASLSENSIDAVITDPPYGSGGFTEAAKRMAKGQGLRSGTLRNVGWFINDNMGAAGMVWLLRSVACGSASVLKPGGSLVIFTDWRMVPIIVPPLESSGLRYNNLIVWNKGAPGLGRGFRPQHEIILQFVKGVGEYYNLSTGNVLNVGRMNVDDREHQTQKPVELLEKLISVVAPPGGIVFDPFAGSGTTAVAARQTGRDYIVGDSSAEYVALMRDRLGKPYTLPMLALEAVGT